MVILSGFVVLFLVILIVVLVLIAYKLGKAKRDSEWQSKLNRLRREIADKQRAGIKGKIAETFAPYLGDFPFKPSECKFIGDPIDYVVFEGLDDRDVRGIHFVDVKTDTSELKKHQKQIKDIINSDGKMSFVEYRFRTKD